MTIHVDDARRWLRANPDRQYDVIVQNTTFHWRASATRLLSREYFRELRGHLHPGGFVVTNTTGSRDVEVTAASVYPHVMRYKNFVYMGDSPFAVRADAEQVLRSASVHGRRAFGEDLLQAGVGRDLLLHRFVPISPAGEADAGDLKPEVVTDRNAVTEFRHGLPSPFAILRPILPRTPNAN